MRCVLTGCAGFIGSHLTDRLLALGHEVTGVDNFSTGRHEFLTNALLSSKFFLLNADLYKLNEFSHIMKNIDIVFHFAANADVRCGIEQPRKDLEQNSIVTSNVLEAMRMHNVKKIVFASTGSIYGESCVIPTPENAPFPIQTSLYGASKLAAEGLIQAYAEGFDMQGYIFRFVSILGERYTHGHVFDFYKQLIQNSNKLHVLGNGKQKKSYLYVHDCLDAIFVALEKAHNKINIFNLGTDEYCEVNDSIQWISTHLNLTPEVSYTGTERGWIGDNPFIFLDCTEIKKLGWKPKLNIRAGVLQTVKFLEEWIPRSSYGMTESNSVMTESSVEMTL